jgi:hypothetical protein
MDFDKLSGIAEQPAKADKSAEAVRGTETSAINRHLRMVGVIC